MNKYFFSFLFLNIVLTQHSTAQYVTKFYNDENGLPQNSVKSIIQSSSGFIWLATENGLARFDGRNFVTFYAEDYGYLSNRFNCLISNDAGENIYGITENRENILINNNFPRKDTNPPKWFVYEISGSTGNIFGVPSKIYPNVHEDRTGMILNDSIEFYHYEDVFGITNSHSDITFSSEHTFKKLGMVMFDDMAYVIDYEGGYYSWSKNTYLVRDSINRFTDLDKPKMIWNRGAKQVFLVDNHNVWLLIPDSSGKLRKLVLVENYDFSGFDVHTCLWNEESKTLFLGSLSKGLMAIRKSIFEQQIGNVNTFDESFYGLSTLDNRNLYTSNGLYFNIEKGRVFKSTYRKYLRAIVAHPDSNAVIRSTFMELVKTNCESGKCLDSHIFSFGSFISAFF